jgi:glycosyltransferase involved in cell wall biosynthesis
MVYLPRLRWRAKHSLAKLREVGFRNVVLEEGLDGYTGDPRDVGERHGWFFDPCLGPGEIGCSVSMLRLWVRVVEERLPYLLIFEDDVLPHPDIAQLGPEYWAETPQDADFVLMGNQMNVSDIAALPDPRRRVVTLPSWCLHAYVITQDGARRGLELVARELASDRWLSPIDVELWRWMEHTDVRHACWNGTMLRQGFPSADEMRGRSELPLDVTRSRATGPFFQNFSLGSSIWPDREQPVAPLRLRRKRRRRHRPRAVFISPVPPGTSGNGLAIRAGVALDALAGAFDVQFVYAPVYGQAPVPPWVGELTSKTLILPEATADPFLRLVPRIATLSERRRALISYPQPFPARFCTSAAAAEIVAFTGGDIDLVYVFRLFLARLAEPWLVDGGDRRTRFALDLDEVEANASRRVAALHRRNGDEGAAEVADADAAKFEHMAQRWAARADLVLASSAHEVASLEMLVPGVRAQVLPNVVPPTGEEGLAPPVDVLFVGNCSYLPNIEAACWFCQDVLPLVRARLRRGVRVAVVGSHVDARVARLAADRDVVVVSDPPSVTPWYRATTIAVVPLRSGGGTRLKILEAFAHRRPVVSTHLGAEGLPVTDGVHLLMADTADDLADACVRLLSDTSLRASLVRSAVEVAIDHSRPSVVTRLTRMLEGVRL